MRRPHRRIHDPSERKNLLKLWCLTIIDYATGWSKMAQIRNKMAAETADITKRTWFSWYPLPKKRIVFDRVTKFMAGFSKMRQNDYGIKMKPITTRNPQSNAIIEQTDQTIGNII